MTPDRLAYASPLRVFVVLGTRPEAIKLAPVIRLLRADPRFACYLALTGQHLDMLAPILRDLELTADAFLDVFEHGQTLEKLTARVLAAVSSALDEVQPHVIVVQGDTTSAFAAALAAFYREVPVVHLEAGLRSRDVRNPFPEEVNRRFISRITDLHLAPTAEARSNLHREGTETPVLVTGNTVIDAFQWARRQKGSPIPEPVATQLKGGHRILLATLHRRESWGAHLHAIAQALRDIARQYPEWRIVLPLHKNPGVRRELVPVLSGIANVVLCEPLAYIPFVKVVCASALVLTDSGGLQEEAPSVGKPVLVARATTERPEGVAAGTVRVVGRSREAIVAATQRLMSDDRAYRAMASAINPYGDGRAGKRVVDALLWRYAAGAAPSEFLATTPDEATNVAIHR